MESFGEGFGEGAGVDNGFLCATDSSGGDEFHSFGDFLSCFDAVDSVADFAYSATDLEVLWKVGF